jgi:class 3 adenylate cyclase/tetratricopeptide (TPR) repeat protein
MESLAAYIPMDRRQAMVRGEELPDKTSGAALFADISGFTPLTEALARELGPRRGAEELTEYLNAVYDVLIAEVHRYRGSVIGFSGDAITCWLDADPSASAVQAGLRATACALALQEAMRQFAELETPSGKSVPLAIKVAVAAGGVRRFLVGDPKIQIIDVLAGTTLDRMAAAEKHANQGEVVLGPRAAWQLGDWVQILERRVEAKTGQGFAVVAGLMDQVEPTPWSTISPSAAGMAEEHIRPWLLRPVYERLSSGQGQFLAELRRAVPLFLRFGGLDYENDETVGQKLDTYIRWVQQVLARYEGRLIQLTTGDKGSYLYAVFGAPLAHDDDACRAVATAIELQSTPPEMDFIAGVQIGISQGRMRTGAYGGTTRRTYGVLGDEVNVAARLMGKAQVGQTLISQRVADAVERDYHLQYVGLMEMKGKQDALPVFTGPVRRPLSPQGPRAVSAAPLAGRADELAQLQRLLLPVLDGKGQIICLEGVAGIGKSRLAAEFIQQAASRGFRVALGTCQSTSRGIAYHPWRQAFRALFGMTDEPMNEDLTAWTAQQIAQVERVIDGSIPEWQLRLPLLRDLLGLEIPDNATTAAFDSASRQEALLVLAVALLHSWAQTGPLMLVIEDGHWMDELSRRLTLAIGRSVAQAPILLTLVQRPFAAGAKSLLPDLARTPGYRQLVLSELSPQAVARLVAHRLQGPPSPLALSLVQAQAQGNPFFSEELVDHLRESGVLYRQDNGTWTLSEAMLDTLRAANCLERAAGEWVVAPDAPLSGVDLGIPDKVEGVVLSRVDRLPEAHKLTLKVASVIGRSFEFDLLAGAHPVDPGREGLLEHIREMEGRDMIRLETLSPLVYAFKHSITQEVTYQTLLEDQRHGLHRVVGASLEGLLPEAVERLAYHYTQGGVRDKSLFYLDKAARKTQREYANRAALNYYDQALALEERWEWLRGKAEILHILGRRGDERATLSRMEGVANAPAFDTAYRWGHYYEAVGKYSQSRDAIEQAMEACREEGNIAGQVRCLARLGSVARRQGDLDDAKDWYQRALHTLPDEDAYLDIKIQALNGLGFVHRQQGNYSEARECYQQALTLSQASGNRLEEAQSLNDLGVTAFYQRDFPEASTFHQWALEIRRTIGDRAGEGASLGNLALVARDSGDYGQAQDYLSDALTIQQAVGNRWDEANVWNDMGIIYLLAGDLPGARDCFEKALELSQEIGAEGIQAYFLGNLGLVVRDLGDLAEAEKLLAEGLAMAQGQGDKSLIALFLSHLGSVSLLAGRLEEALERANTALAMRRALNLQVWTTADLTTLASAYLALDDMPQALDHARQALAILDECDGEGAEYPHRDYFVCYQVLAADGQVEAARAALASAYRLVMNQADKIIDPALRQSFLEKVEINREIVREYENL